MKRGLWFAVSAHVREGYDKTKSTIDLLNKDRGVEVLVLYWHSDIVWSLKYSQCFMVIKVTLEEANLVAGVLGEATLFSGG